MSTRYQLDMDQQYFQQTLAFSIGLPKGTEASVSIPLYHFNGDNLLTQDGVTVIGPVDNTRNFWGALSLKLKHLIREQGPHRFLAAAYFQFPEGNQRGRGGTTSGQWAFNGIYHRDLAGRRFTLNLGWTQPGDLKLLNDQTLRQENGWFAGAALSQKLNPTSAVEVQVHVDQSALRYTGLEDFEDPQVNVGLGYRKQIRKSLDISLSAFGGFQGPVKGGTSLDFAYLW